MPLLSSPRARRRAVWATALAAVAATTAAVIVMLPKGTPERETFRPGAEVVRTPRHVRLTPARRQAIDRLLDAFVPTAVERRKPLRALPLVTRSFRSGVSRDEWARGNLPVFPYTPRGERFHGWTLNYSYPREISVDLLLHPAEKEQLGPLAVTAVFKQVRGHWLIDSFVAAASFSPEHKKPRILAQPDFTPFAETRGSAQLSKRWLFLPAGVLALALLVPLGFGVAHMRRSRRAWRAYRADVNRGT
jgi:hypothetical protein